MTPLRFLARVTTITLFLLWHLVRWSLVWVGLRLRLRAVDERRRWFGDCLLGLFRDLGATFIKIGQIMSTRPDLLPPHVVGALEKLQDQVGAFDYGWVRRTFLEDFGAAPEEVFEEFTRDPVASASVAQVHRARLPGGRVVAVKVRRPGIEQIVGFDLAVIRLAARALALVPSIRPLAPVEAVDEFGRAIRLQLDLELEARNGARFRACFAGDPDVVFPALVREYSSRRVLTMEYIDGVKILQIRKTPHDGARIARIGFRTLLKMVFEDGFVHADLHPGNIFITDAGRLALLDLGLVATLDEGHRAQLARFFAAWVAGDGATMARVLAELSPSGDRIPDRAGFERAVVEFVQKTRSLRMGDLRVGGVVLDMMHILRRHRVRVSSTFTMVSIAIAVTEGIGKQLDPTLDLMQEALPFFARFPFGPPGRPVARA